MRIPGLRLTIVQADGQNVKVPQVRKGPGVQTISAMPMDRTGEPGERLEDVGHKVLVYRDLMALDRNHDERAPSRSLDIRLTDNRERFMWSFDGVKMSDMMEPIPFVEGERVRFNLINDSMMGRPIHIHGHFFEPLTGHAIMHPASTLLSSNWADDHNLTTGPIPEPAPILSIAPAFVKAPNTQAVSFHRLSPIASVPL